MTLRLLIFSFSLSFYCSGSAQSFLACPASAKGLYPFLVEIAVSTTMASEFIGYNVCVTLKTPPNAQIRGEVADVVGQRLLIRNGACYFGLSVTRLN